MLMAVGNCSGQEPVESRYYMVGSFSNAAMNADSSYRVDIVFQSDQTGNGYLANQLQVGWRVFTSTRRKYVIDTIHTSSFTSATVTLRRLAGEAGVPSGISMAYQYDGSTEALPVPPVNSTGISAAMASIVQTHNAVLGAGGGSGGGAPEGQRIWYVNWDLGDDATGEMGNPAKPFKTYIGATYDPNEAHQPGDIIYTYQSTFVWQDLPNAQGQTNPRIVNPPDSLIYVFDEVEMRQRGTTSTTMFYISQGDKASDDYPEPLPFNRLRFMVRGNLILNGIGLLLTWNDPDETQASGEHVPTIRADVEVKEIKSEAYNQFSSFNFNGGYHDVDIKIDEATDLTNTIFSPAGYVITGEVDPTSRKKDIRVTVNNFRPRPDATRITLLKTSSFAPHDSSRLYVRVNNISLPVHNPSLGSQTSKWPLLALFDNGFSWKNGYIELSLGNVTVERYRDSAYVGQPVSDYAAPNYTANIRSDEARMIFFGGEYTGTKIKIHCDNCNVQDGFILLDQVTGDPEIQITGRYNSYWQSVVKMNQPTSDADVWLNGYFSSNKAPAISSGLTAPGGGNPVRMTGVFRTESTSMPVLAINRHVRLFNAYLERPVASAGRPVIESNTAGTVLQHHNVAVISAGDAVGANIVASSMPTIPN